MSFEVDEKLPVSRGGSPYTIENTGPAHRCCNEWKSSMTLEEAVAKLRSTTSMGEGRARHSGRI